MEGIGEIDYDGHCQLWVLFWTSFKDLQSRTILEKTLTFERMYRRMLANRLSILLSYKLLNWALERNITRQIGIYMSNEQGSYKYNIVEISNIFCIIHVIPNFVENNQFYVNK